MATLKISELSVGDWVEFHHIKGVYIARPSFDKAIAQVIGTHRGAEVSVLVDGKREFYAIPLSAIQPIPITPEILDKNGFELPDKKVYMDTWSWTNKVDTMVEVSMYKDRCYLRVVRLVDGLQEDRVCHFPLYYIHQLQHALRLAGVDKEINL